jgi:hypothetical protein
VALNKIAQTLNGIHRFRDAISVAKQGVQIDPKNDMLHVSAIYALSVLLDHAGVVEHCTEAVELLPDNAFIQFMLANLGPTDHHRSVQLDTLRPLFAQPGITWFSVQNGKLERQSEGLANEFDFHTLGPAISDFSDTLAAIQ